MPSSPLHCGFTVADGAATLRFLCDCLGFERLSWGPPANPSILERIIGIEDARATIGYARLGTLTLELLEYSAPASRRAYELRACDVGFAHIAVAVDDVSATVRRAREYGFEPSAAVVRVPAGPNAGRCVVYLRDRSGFTVELMGGE